MTLTVNLGCTQGRLSECFFVLVFLVILLSDVPFYLQTCIFYKILDQYHQGRAHHGVLPTHDCKQNVRHDIVMGKVV